MSEIDRPQITRRTALKRGAIAGGALVWATPVVQSFGGTAFAQEENGTPLGNGPCEATATALDLNASASSPSAHIVFDLTEQHSCGTCEEDVRITWSCENESDFECDLPPDPADAATTWGGDIAGFSDDASVVVIARIEVECEDGAQASACIARSFSFSRVQGERGAHVTTVTGDEDASGAFCP